MKLPSSASRSPPASSAQSPPPSPHAPPCTRTAGYERSHPPWPRMLRGLRAPLPPPHAIDCRRSPLPPRLTQETRTGGKNETASLLLPGRAPGRAGGAYLRRMRPGFLRPCGLGGRDRQIPGLSNDGSGPRPVPSLSRVPAFVPQDSSHLSEAYACLARYPVPRASSPGNSPVSSAGKEGLMSPISG